MSGIEATDAISPLQQECQSLIMQMNDLRSRRIDQRPQFADAPGIVAPYSKEINDFISRRRCNSALRNCREFDKPNSGVQQMPRNLARRVHKTNLMAAVRKAIRQFANDRRNRPHVASANCTAHSDFE